MLFIIALMPTVAFFLGFWLYALHAPVRYLLGSGMRRAKGLPCKMPARSRKARRWNFGALDFACVASGSSRR